MTTPPKPVRIPKRRTLRGGPLSLRDIATRLNDDRLLHVVATYSEYTMSLRRVIVAALLLCWSLAWSFVPESKLATPALRADAQHLEPWLAGFLLLSVLWMTLVRSRRVKPTDTIDAAGAVANIVAICLLLHISFELALPLIAVLPLTTIVIGARFGRGVFYGSVALSTLAIFLAPTPLYWSHHLVFIPFVAVLLVGVPLTVNRLSSAINSIADSALHSRDAQARFLATMSHELRTPLTPLLHNLALIDASHLGGEDQQLLSTSRAMALAIRRRVDQILDVAAIDAGTLHLEEEPFTLSTLVSMLESVTSLLAEPKGVALNVQLKGATGVVLLGAVGRIEQCLTNLVSNAIKFTPVGGWVDITIELKRTSSMARDARLVCSVADNGIGVKDEDKDRIFQAFYQVSSGTTRSYEGFGLGLHIVRSIIRQMGGRVTVADNEPNGAVFRVDIPLQVVTEYLREAKIQDPAEALAAHRRTAPSLRCLLIEDHAPNKEAMTLLLSRAGHQVESASDGKSGIAMVASGAPFDVIFLDMHMPDMGGLEVLGEIGAIPPRGKRPAVVIMSADSDPLTMTVARAKGAVEYLVKPVSIDRLLRLLEQLGLAGTSDADRGDTRKRTTPRGGEASLSMLRTIAAPEQLRDLIETSRINLQEDVNRVAAGLRAQTPEEVAAGLNRLQNVFLSLGIPAGIEACAHLRQAQEAGRPTDICMQALEDAAKEALGRLDRELSDVSRDG